MSSTVIDLAGRKAILSIARDISERKLADEALRDSESRFRALIEQAPVAISVSRDGIGLYANQKFVEMLGLGSADEAVGRPIADYLTDPESSDERRRLQTLGLPVAPEWEANGIRADGSPFPVSVALEQVQLPDGPAHVAFVTDLTSRRAAEVERERARSHLRAVFDSTADLVWSVNPEDFGLVSFNRGLADYFLAERGMQIKVGDPPATLLPSEEGAQTWRDLYTRALREGSMTADYSTVVGSRILELHFNVLEVDGSVFGISVFGRDVTAQRSAQIELRRSEEQLQDIFDSLGDGVAIIGFDGGILEVNQALVDMLGYSRDQLFAMSFGELSAPAMASLIEERMEVVRGGGIHVFQSARRRGDGTEIPVETSARIITFRGQPAILTVQRDVSERRRLHKALELSEAKFSTAFKTSPDSVNINRLSDGLYLDISDGFTESTGFTREFVQGKTSAEIGIWADPRTRARFVELLQADGVVRNLEMRFRRQDGSIGNGLISGRLIEVDGETCILSITRDITNFLLAEQRFRTLFDATNDSIMIRDEDSGRILEANRAACERLGYSREELLKKTAADIVTLEVAASFAARSRAIEEHGSTSFEADHLHRDGTTIPVEINACVIDENDRKVVLSIARDIRERRQAEAARAVLEEQLHQAAKEEDIGRLAGGIAHDFNNLLTAIRGYTSLALAQLPPGEGPREDLEQVEKSADSAAALTKQLLAFARKTVLEPRVIHLGEVVRRVKPMLERLLGEDIKLVTTTAEGCWIMADPGKIEQVIVNLVVNAVDAMPDGGTLTIEVGGSSGSPASGRPVGLSVADTGTGMDAETLSHLFEPFFTTKGPGKGTGLGLATVAGIVRQSGGTVQASSEPGQGSKFTIAFPAVDPPTSQGGVHPSDPSLRKAGSGTILLVEDDAGVRGFVSRVLSNAGYRVLEARDGADAIEIGQNETIELLLTDVRMPEMSGPEVVSRLSSLRPGLPVLFMSGHTDKGFARDGGLDPAMRLLEKPFTAEGLLGAVHGALATEPNGAGSRADRRV